MKDTEYYTFDGFERNFGKPQVVSNLDAHLHDDPHYSDKRFKEPQTIFGKEEKGLSYDYSDRFTMWNYDKHKLATNDADNSGAARHTARWYQEYLSSFFGRKIQLKHIVAGVNLSDGYSYLVYGYK